MAACRGCGTQLEGRRQKCDDCKRGREATLTEVIQRGDFIESQKRLAVELSRKLEDAGSAQVGPITKQLREVLDELALLKVQKVPEKPKPEPAQPAEPTPTEGGTVHELARRRADRRAGAASEAPS